MADDERERFRDERGRGRPDDRRGAPGGQRRGPDQSWRRGGQERNLGPTGRQRGGFGQGPRREFDERPRRDFEQRRGPPDRPRRDFARPPWERDAERRQPEERDQPRGREGRYDERPGRQGGARPGGPGRSFGERRDWRETGRFREAGHDRRPSFDRQRPPPERERRPSPVTAEQLLGADEELVAGRRPVEEAFAARREALRLLVVPERRTALDALVLHATTARIPVVEVEGGTLTSLAGFDGHQGVALAVPARVPATLDDVLARARERSETPFVLVLDSLEDPQNLGTLLRSAEACGVHGVIFPTRRSAPLSPSAIKASAGATEHLLLVPVDDLAGTLADLRSRRLRLVGADEGAPLRYAEADLRGPIGLVVGSEERGISGALRRRLDLLVRIPMRGRIASLNAAVAGSVLLFAAAEQRGAPEAGEGRPPAPPADDGAGESAKESRPRAKRARRAAPATGGPGGEAGGPQGPAGEATDEQAVSEAGAVDGQPQQAIGDDLLPGESTPGDELPSDEPTEADEAG